MTGEKLLRRAHGVDEPRQPRDPPRRRIRLKDTLLAAARDDRLGQLQGRDGSILIARRQGVLDPTDKSAHATPAAAVYGGAPFGLPQSFLCLFAMRHD